MLSIYEVGAGGPRMVGEAGTRGSSVWYREGWGRALYGDPRTDPH